MSSIILNFHGIGSCFNERELGESRYWIDPGFFREIIAMVATPEFSSRVGITFDDGNISDIVVGAEVLARYNISAKFFIIADRIDSAGNLSRQDIVDLSGSGHEIGTHGSRHLDWTTLDAVGFVRELDHSRDVIGSLIGKEVSSAALPLGRYDRRVLRALADRSIRSVFSSDGGAAKFGQSPVPRTSVTRNMKMSDIHDILEAREPLTRSVRRKMGQIKKMWF
jgi:peptidoglycan/xylan/chitin deacetylase (PgdA/CDA1 family)